MTCKAPVGRRFFLYHTICEIILWDAPEDPGRVLDECEHIAGDVQSMLNAYDPDSELGRMNRLYRPGTPYRVSPELYALLREMHLFSARCGGAYDATVRPLVELWDFTAPSPRLPGPEELREARSRCGYHRVAYDDAAQTLTFSMPGMAIDPGGVGKGYAAGKVADYLRERGVGAVSINFGGEMVLLGRCPNTADGLWRVGVQRPWSRQGEVAEVITVPGGKAVASSGGYDRFFTAEGKCYCHLLDPRTGRPVSHRLQGVTIVCCDPLLAELASTAFFVLGEERGADLIARLNKETPIDYLAVGEQGISTSNEFNERRNIPCVNQLSGISGKKWIG